MKYSYLWLKELSGTKKSPKQLADLLMMRSFEFEEMKKEGKETQLIFDVLANRGHDALSHIGMAREICAIEGRKYKNESLVSKMEAKLPSDYNKIKIEIKDKKLCRRYIGIVLENIEVKPSPKWIVDRLLVCGIKPINNIVDITNYIMLETGQPLHAFDAAKIATSNAKPEIVIRRAKNGEKLLLLDEKEYELSVNNLVIADKKKAIALAGIMGGSESSISDKTKCIILESANFDPVNIRKTRTVLGVSTESSYRFERELDPNLAGFAAARAIELLQKFGGKNVKLMAYSDMYSKKIRPWTIKLNIKYVKKLLGENISSYKIKHILENLGISVKIQKNTFNCKIPTFRIDLKSQEDLIEEIGRIYGYENISAKAPIVELTLPTENKKKTFENNLRDIMTGLGFSEMINYSFYSADDIKKCRLSVADHFEIFNPMNPNQQYLRTTLMPGILKNIELNTKNFDKFSIFEIGRIYLNPNQKIPVEKTILAGSTTDIEENTKKDIFLKLKGKIEALLKKIGICNVQYAIMHNAVDIYHPTRSAVIKSGNNRIIGYIGEINPQIASDYKIKIRTAIFELDIAQIYNLAPLQNEYKPISKFPSVKRDISMFIPENVVYADIETKIMEAGEKLVNNIELFDIFEKEGKKSLALRIEIGSREKTLTSDEIYNVMKKIITKLEKDLHVKIRR